jgi:hypothetical protein
MDIFFPYSQSFFYLDNDSKNARPCYTDSCSILAGIPFSRRFIEEEESEWRDLDYSLQVCAETEFMNVLFS